MTGLHRASQGLVGAALLVAGMTVYADGFYGGAAVARTEVKDLCNDLSAVVALASCDESSTGWRVFLGYRFGRYFGAEFEYSSLGDSGVEATTTSGVNLSAKGGGFGASVEVRAPLSERWEAYLKGGMYWWDAEAIAAAGSTIVRAEDDDIEPMYGGGVRFGVNEQLYVGFDWRRYTDIGGNDVDAIGLGFELRQKKR